MVTVWKPVIYFPVLTSNVTHKWGKKPQKGHFPHRVIKDHLFSAVLSLPKCHIQLFWSKNGISFLCYTWKVFYKVQSNSFIILQHRVALWRESMNCKLLHATQITQHIYSNSYRRATAWSEMLWWRQVSEDTIVLHVHLNTILHIDRYVGPVYFYILARSHCQHGVLFVLVLVTTPQAIYHSRFVALGTACTEHSHQLMIDAENMEIKTKCSHIEGCS